MMKRCFCATLIEFQDYFRIHATGTLADKTIKLMSKRPCGVRDFPQKFVLYNGKDGKRNKTQIGWKFVFSDKDDKIIAKAFSDKWSRHTNLTFYVKERKPVIVISYGAYDHPNYYSSHGKMDGYQICGPGTHLSERLR
ncbi:hypothetical protein WA026_015681 [Henosepilachna vigintioctopunctata]|uniref:Uncharacterized protein n=1 Tax=Henosepilachna vigintioctopunctata TaxID=420089 RepID=A0AAW1UYE8_9CUCU